MSTRQSTRFGPFVGTKRFGLTLMELVVVLVILVALGAILLPMLPNLLTKAHDATTVTNIAELNKAVVSFYTVNLKYPDQFDSLFDSSGAVYTKAIFYPNGASPTFTPSSGTGTSPAFTTGTLTAGEVSGMNFGGITTFMVMKSNPVSATFDAYVNNGIGTGSTVTIAAGTSVLVADDDYILQKLNMVQKKDSTGALARYIVLGLGPKCTLVGNTAFGIFNAPVCFGEHDVEQPNNSYARLLMVFRVYNDGTRAEYVGAAHPDSTGLGTSDMHLQEFYTNN